MTTSSRKLWGVIALTLAGVAVWAHMTGQLTPLYHQLGWHHGPVGESATDHSGHAGMAMPGMNMPGMETPATKPSTTEAMPPTLAGYSTVSISTQRQQLIGVRTGKVEKDRLRMSIRAVGTIEPDQTRLARIQSRIRGWVTKVHVNYVGQSVKQGEPLLEIYSPELLATQQEFLVALANSGAGVGISQQQLIESARRRLELWGVPREEIAELERTKKARDVLLLPAPISGKVLDRNVLEGTYIEPSNELYRIADLSVVWLQAKIYEYELPHITVGQPVTIGILSEPGVELHGKVAFVEPVVQELTRTVKVRIEIPNADDLLKPGMYADLKIIHDMGDGLLVPDSAVLRTGERNVAFRALTEGRFEPAEVTLGGRFGDRVQILSGLNEGDAVVTSATFLIDSESRLRATSMGGGQHHHGG